jgi:hypothetical protein
MNSKNIIKTSLAIVIALTASFASADSFSVLVSGPWLPSGLNIISGDSLVPVVGQLQNNTVVSNIGGAVIDINETLPATPAGVDCFGTVVVSAGSGFTGTATFSLEGKIYSGATLSFAGTGTLLSDSGSWAHYSSGVVNVSYQFVSIPDANVAVGTISANLQAVPEPAPLALLGLGACGLLLRRRS